jgi:hypothetical protein
MTNKRVMSEKRKNYKEIREKRKDEKYPVKYSIIQCTYKVMHSSIREKDAAERVIWNFYNKTLNADEDGTLLQSWWRSKIFDNENDDMVNFITGRLPS